MSLWAFRFLLWYLCVMLVQPQNRFLFLWPLHIADIAFIGAIALHGLSCLEGKTPLVRVGPATLLAFALLFFATLSQNFGAYQFSPGWNADIDVLVKNSLLLILVEAMATSVQRIWAVQMTTLFCTLWWVKGGLRLSAMGATYSGDRLMGAAVSLIENPNGFAYMMCVFLPLYLYAYQQAPKKWQRWFFLAIAFAISAWLAWLLSRPLRKTEGLSYSLILGGALGNAFDRATRGHVIDYIDFHLHGWHWPAFNIADMAIVGGAIALVAQSFMSVENPAATKESQ